MSRQYIFSPNQGYYNSQAHVWVLDYKQATPVENVNDVAYECGRIDASLEYSEFIQLFDRKSLIQEYANQIANCQDKIYENKVVELFSQGGMHYCEKGVWRFDGSIISNEEVEKKLNLHLQDKIESIIKPLAEYEQGTQLVVSDDQSKYWFFATPF